MKSAIKSTSDDSTTITDAYDLFINQYILNIWFEKMNQRVLYVKDGE